MIRETSDNVVLILCSGRTGGTTLMRVLNTLPGYRLCGENGGCIERLLEAYGAFLEARRHRVWMTPGHKPTWLNVFDSAQVRENFIGLIRTFFRADEARVWGFKEIRFGAESLELFTRKMESFRDLFPHTKIVFGHRRDIDAQCHSGWWAGKPENVARTLIERKNAVYQGYLAAHPDHCYMVALEDMVERTATFTGLFDFLGETPDWAEVDKVLADNMES